MNKSISRTLKAITILLLSSCTSLIYTNNFNKRNSDFKLNSNDTIAIGTIIFNDLSISQMYSDSIYSKLKRKKFTNLIHPENVKNELQSNKIYALPTIFSQELCGDIYKILKTRYFLNSFILTRNKADYDKNGKIQVQFDLYDLILSKNIWSCNSSIDMFPPEKYTDRGINFGGITSIDWAFDKLIRKVIDNEITK